MDSIFAHNIPDEVLQMYCTVSWSFQYWCS